MNRKYPKQPLVGVGALIKRGDSVLLVRRENEPGKGLWSIPGGLLEVGETLEEAVKREVKEETGLEVKIEHLLDVVDFIKTDEDGKIQYHYVLIDFLTHLHKGTPRIKGEISDVRWVKKKEIASYRTTKTLRGLLKKIGFYEDVSEPSEERHPEKVEQDRIKHNC